MRKQELAPELLHKLLHKLQHFGALFKDVVYKQTNKQTNKQTYIHTNKHTYILTYILRSFSHSSPAAGEQQAQSAANKNTRDFKRRKKCASAIVGVSKKRVSRKFCTGFNRRKWPPCVYSFLVVFFFW